MLARRPELRVFALGWDFSVIYTLERERLPAYRFAWNAPPSPRRSSSTTPTRWAPPTTRRSSSSTTRWRSPGGLDLTIRRWDTPAHRAARPRPGRPRRPPLSAPARRADDGRRRGGGRARASSRGPAGWRRRDAPMPRRERPPGGPILWPDAVPPDARDAPIGIARTMPAARRRARGARGGEP